MAQTLGPCTRANPWAKLSFSPLTTKFTSPWRNSDTSFERCRATFTKPMLSNSRPSASGSGAVYSTNSKPSVPMGLTGSASSSLGSLTFAMFDLQSELVSNVTIMPNPSQALELEKFLPYRLSVLAQVVSEALHDLYAGPFDLAVTEWRVMAALGRFAPLTASEVGQRIVMDKVAVSRAVARLMKRGLVERTADRADRRRAPLKLSARGRGVHARIVPLALEYEARLYGTLSVQERHQFAALSD